MNRWTVVAGAIAIQLCLGAIYAWSVFVDPLKESYGFSTTETQIVFSLGLASFAITMIFAGRWQDKKGPRLIATAGGAVLGLGYLIGGLSGGSFPIVALGVGVIGGAGIGLGYVCPLAAGMKWFPDKKGLISGIAVAGFGAGAWLFSAVAESVIVSDGVLKAFVWLGIIFTIMVVAGAQLLRNPPAGWAPKGPVKVAKRDFEWRGMIKTRQFWMLWLMFLFAAIAGLMVIGILKPFGIFSGLDAAVAGAAVGVLAIFNGAGRIAWGSASDKLGRHWAMLLMFSLQGVMMLSLMAMGGSELTLALAAAWVGFNFGGNFALFPSATADFFGSRNLGMNYGLVFTSYGTAGIIGPLLGGMVFDATGSYVWAFMPAGALCLAAAGLAFFTRAPKAD
jgi:MFS transporter, OFA family, oxalate/formate antiporter